MRKIEYVASDERLITPSGLSLVGQVLGKSNLIKKANCMRTVKRSQPQIKNGDIILTMIGLLSLGKSDFENVNEFHKDEEFYKIALGIAYGIPSESSLRNRLDGIGTSMDQQILAGNVDMFLSCGYEPSPLANGCVPVDIDVSPFDNSGSHKAGVSRTYKNFDGYAPIFAYIGTEGYLCNAELREGRQHCQSGTPEFLTETIAAAKQMTKKALLFRMDSGNDALENMLLLHWHDPQLKFLIKHNFRREDRYAIAEELKNVCKNVKHPRDGKTVYIGSTWRNFETEKDGKFAIRMVYEITERTTDANGQDMLFPEGMTDGHLKLCATEAILITIIHLRMYYQHKVLPDLVCSLRKSVIMRFILMMNGGWSVSSIHWEMICCFTLNYIRWDIMCLFILILA